MHSPRHHAKINFSLFFVQLTRFFEMPQNIGQFLVATEKGANKWVLILTWTPRPQRHWSEMRMFESNVQNPTQFPESN